MHEIVTQTDFQAAPEVVFDYFADHEKFARLFGGSAKRVKAGSDEPDGLGSVRRIGAGPLAFEETIVVFERPLRIDYAITRGSPLKNHLGSIRFSPHGGGTRVDYSIRFESKLPLLGHLIAFALKTAYQRGVRKLQAELR